MKRYLISCPFSGLFLLLLTAFLSPVVSAENIVKTYPAPEGEKVSGVYTVTVDGKTVDVYKAQSEFFDGDYYFAYFDFSGNVTVEIQSAFPMNNAQLLPAQRFGLVAQSTQNAITFQADKPFRVSVEPNGRIKPLLLFGNALETNPPKEGDANVLYFGPGVHKTDMIKLTDNQTLYLAGGAVVKGVVYATGKNITICGRGVLSGEIYPRFQGAGRFLIDCQNCEDVTIQDIILRDPFSWTAVTWNCDKVLIDGLKICGSRMLNDDALDLVNTSNAIVRNCFFRTQDDSIAIKGMDLSNRACDNILIENCQFWTDRADVYRIGYECDALAMRNIVSRGIDVLHYSKEFREPTQYWSTAIIWLQPDFGIPIEDVIFDDMVIYSDGSKMTFVEAKPIRCTTYQTCVKKGKNTWSGTGTVKNCTFTNIKVIGHKGDFSGYIYLRGVNEKNSISGFNFKQIDYFGDRIIKQSNCVEIGPFVNDIEFE